MLKWELMSGWPGHEARINGVWIQVEATVPSGKYLNVSVSRGDETILKLRRPASQDRMADLRAIETDVAAKLTEQADGLLAIANQIKSGKTA